MNNYDESWERFLDPEIVKPSLFMATMFITTFEILKNSVIDRIRDFFSDGWSAMDATQAPEYKEKVLSRKKKV